MEIYMKKIISLFILGLIIFSIIGFSFINLISALTVDSVSFINEIKPGKTTTISIGLENDANEDIEDVSVILDLTELPFAPYNSASEYTIEKIKEGGIKSAEFEMIVLNNAK